MTKTDLNEMNLIDDFLMKLVASNPDYGDDFCRTLLSVLLEKKIGKVKVVAQSVIPGISPLHRGVRLDVEVEEKEDKNDDGVRYLVFNTEGTKGGSESIRNMLKYICNSKPEGAVDAATKEVDEYVSNIRHDPDVLEGVMTVGDVIDREKKESFDLGMKQGIEQGKEAAVVSMIAKMLESGYSIESISPLVGKSVDEIKSLMNDRK